MWLSAYAGVEVGGVITDSYNLELSVANRPLLMINTQHCCLHTGDRVFHGVDGMQKDTAPGVWNDSSLLNANNRLARVGLLFRDGH